MIKTLIFTTIFILMASTSVFAERGDRGLMSSACQSSSTSGLKRLCRVVNDYFKAQQSEYIHLGSEFYLILAPNVGSVGQGIYTVNIKSDQIQMFGGYGLPRLGELKQLPDGSVNIKCSYSSMSHGNYGKSEYILQIRTNPLTKTPYLVMQKSSELLDASEELESFCSNSANKNHEACREKSMWGKKVNKTNSISTKSLIKAHQEALSLYKRSKDFSNFPSKILEDAGVREIIDKQPKDMSLHKYVNILNDYAFFAYRYGEGRCELAIEILNKVIQLSPERTPAYLNMAQALKSLAEYSKHTSSIPLDDDLKNEINMLSKKYMEQYNAMKEKKKIKANQAIKADGQ